MKTGIYHWFGYGIEPRTKYKMIRDAGFDNVLLWWGDEYENETGKKEHLPDLARNAGLFVENVHVPFENVNSLWTETHNTKDVLLQYISCIKDCATYEIPTIVFHLTYTGTPPPYSQWGLSNILSIKTAAEKYGVNIAFENLRRPDYIDYVFENIDSERFKLCYDTGHENCFSKTDMLEKYGERLIALHLHDNLGSHDDHLIPGDGEIDWQDVARKIKNTGFCGSVTLECTNTGQELYKDMSAEEFLKRSYESAQEIIKLMEKS